MSFTNLDELRAKSEKVVFLEKEFEVGYIPSGLSIPLLENHNKNIKEQTENDSLEKLLKDNIRSVSIFCSFFEPDFTEEYLSKNATSQQIAVMYQRIVTAIVRNFSELVPNTAGSDGESQKKTTGEI